MSLGQRVVENPTGGGRNGWFAFNLPRLTLAVLAGILVVALGACGTEEASTPAPYAAADTDGPTVVLEDLEFGPDSLTVQAGDTVTWVWNDEAVQHDVTGDGFKSEIQAEGTFRHRFAEPGTYDYICSLHPNMTGTIEVTR